MAGQVRQDTIAAISTPPGEGAIGIVRLSGPGAIGIVAGIFASTGGRDIAKEPRRVFHGEIRHDSQPIDEVLVHVMRAPHSYTREDVVEINCHGGAAPVRAILELTIRHGARLAAPGEFTRRAFLSGRIDLVQAEAVIDRIRAQTHAALRAASSAASGRLSQGLHTMQDTLRGALARVEAAIDFPDEDLPELVDENLRNDLEACLAEMSRLLETADAGRLLREGASVAIAGRPNVGKSSLFNALLRDARAIVTEHAGTTRDILEEVITVDGIPVRLTDTAGLRSAEDAVERIGVEVARNALRQADAVLLVADSQDMGQPADTALAGEITGLQVPVLLVMNKCDLAPKTAAPDWWTEGRPPIRVSAKTGEGLADLEHALAQILMGEGAALHVQDALLTRVHQRDSLARAKEALQRLLQNYGASPEFLSLDLREALAAVGEITGETTPETILDQIFAGFCIGK